MTAAKAPFAKMTSQMKNSRPLRIMVLGQGGVGKSALVVRFITRRYIGEYDPTLEKLYSFHTLIDSEMAHLDILDTAGQPHETECPTLEANIRWAEAFVLMYSVTDKCSFDECNRLKFLINYNKRRRRLSSAKVDAPVVLVGNKTDQLGDRMVSFEEGRRRCIDIGCVSFHEISVREHIDEVWDVFRDVVRCYRALAKGPKLKRSSSELPDSHDSSSIMTGDSIRSGHSQTSPGITPALGRRWTEVGPEDVEEGEEERKDRLLPFRDRASTDGTLFSRPRRRWRYPSTTPAARAPLQDQLADRRMSISMRGNSSAY